MTECPFEEQRDDGEQRRTMDRVTMQLDRVNEYVEEFRAAQRDILQQIKQLHTEIVGNGKQGIKERLNLVETRQREQNESLVSHKDAIESIRKKAADAAKHTLGGWQMTGWVVGFTAFLFVLLIATKKLGLI